jgi:hypothetical protein
MKKTTTIAALLILGLLASWWLYSARQPKEELGKGPAPKPEEAQFNGAVLDTNAVATPPPPDSDLVRGIREYLDRRFQEENVSVKFYGKFVDQYQQPVPGVKVEVVYDFYVTTDFIGNAAAKENWSSGALEVVSDEHGCFTVSGFKASRIKFPTIEKEGYALPDRYVSSMVFGGRNKDDYTPDANNPVLYQLWKKGSPAPLIYVEQRIRLEPDTTAVSFNWLTGQTWPGTNQSADALLHLERHYSADLPHFMHQWTLTLIALNDSGWQETKDPHMRLLPETGFQNALQYDSRTVLQQGWRGTGGGEIKYYLRARAGQLTAAFHADLGVRNNGSASLRYRGYFNPTGSRNLEPDPEKLITDPEEIRRLDEASRRH